MMEHVITLAAACRLVARYAPYAWHESCACSSGNSLASKDALKPYAAQVTQVFGRAHIKLPADKDGILVAVVCALIACMQWPTMCSAHLTCFAAVFLMETASDIQCPRAGNPFKPFGRRLGAH